jgi:hypothetical protein
MNIERRDFLKTGVLGAAGLAAGCSGQDSNTSRDQQAVTPPPPTASPANGATVALAIGGAILTVVRDKGTVVQCLFPPRSAAMKPHDPALLAPTTWFAKADLDALVTLTPSPVIARSADFVLLKVAGRVLRFANAQAGAPALSLGSVPPKGSYTADETLSLNWLVPLHAWHAEPAVDEQRALGQVVIDAGAVFSVWNAETMNEEFRFRTPAESTGETRSVSDWLVNAVAPAAGASLELHVGDIVLTPVARSTGSLGLAAVVNFPLRKDGDTVHHDSHLPLLYDLLDVRPEDQRTMEHVGNPHLTVGAFAAGTMESQIVTFVQSDVPGELVALGASKLSPDSSGCPNGVVFLG